uniref:Uncharacterized protein n=1 Tax=Avena sativa TaxID=4498 RepID=A0ACD5ZJU3_AVESA
MRQILHLKQTDTVVAYSDKFNNLRHQILLHDPNTSEVFFVERYITGLDDEIRSAVLLSLPEDMDTASMMALLQEAKRDNIRQHSHRQSSRHSYKHSSMIDKAKSVARFEDTKKHDAPKWDEKLEALRSFRKSKGLCFTCDDRWSRTHKCPAQVLLHVLEELLDVLPPDQESTGDNSGTPVLRMSSCVLHRQLIQASPLFDGIPFASVVMWVIILC